MSDLQIDYRVRPAKHVERKMLCDIFRCLRPFGSLESYRYLGFGAIYFADFVLVHKSLGLHNMLSMERDPDQENRFRFNCPYKCITLDFHSSNEVLPSLPDWDVRTIAWFDYTDKLDQNILSDISCFIGNACPGSVMVVTINCHADKLDGTPGPLEKLKEKVGIDNVPRDVTDRDLAGWGTASVSKRVIDNTIAEALSVRNGPRAAGTHFHFQQLVHFRYSDGARMLTLGGVIFDDGQQSVVASCGFDRFDFFKRGDDFYHIEVPALTFMEKRYLDSKLPLARGEAMGATEIPVTDVDRYIKLYRYFPTFVDIEP
jgi:hypothetical protein